MTVPQFVRTDELAANLAARLQGIVAPAETIVNCKSWSLKVTAESLGLLCQANGQACKQLVVELCEEASACADVQDGGRWLDGNEIE